ncbi:MAG: hypothetical protein J0H98_01345 [Solirubrobacterales bacterium]|nr:hypothetical protein [Solirubrobacterales bacterium]
MSAENNGTNPIQWGYSLENHAEIMQPCLEARGTETLLEIGSFAGELTESLLEWGTPKGVRISTVEPLPPEELRGVVSRHPELTLIEDTGVGALDGLDGLPDTIIIDGDHNYFTLTGELDKIAEMSGDGPLPLLMFHDVCWPHERRDTYYAPDRVPESERQPLGHNCTIAPGNPGLSDGGLPFEWAAAHEGGPKNGVLTAIEDFMERRGGLRLAVIPVFFGFGVLWEESAPYADAVHASIAPYDRNPVMERAEANRVALLVRTHQDAQTIREQNQRIAQYEELLGRMLQSSALGIAERISKVRQKGNPIFTRQEIQDTLDGK